MNANQGSNYDCTVFPHWQFYPMQSLPQRSWSNRGCGANGQQPFHKGCNLDQASWVYCPCPADCFILPKVCHQLWFLTQDLQKQGRVSVNLGLMIGPTPGHPFARIAALFQGLLLQGLLSFLKDPYPFARIGEDILKNSILFHLKAKNCRVHTFPDPKTMSKTNHKINIQYWFWRLQNQ